MLEANEALILIVVMMLFGFANVFFGRDIFRPLLLVYGFAGGAMAVAAVADATGTEASIGAILIVGGIFAGLSFVVFYAGIAILGAGVGVLFISMLAAAFRTEPSSLVLFATVIVCAGAAVVLHDYVLMFGTALGGAIIIAQAIYLFFPDTRAKFSFLDGLEFVNVSQAALLIGAVITVVLTVLGTYMQWHSFQEHQHQNY